MFGLCHDDNEISACICFLNVAENINKTEPLMCDMERKFLKKNFY